MGVEPVPGGSKVIAVVEKALRVDAALLAAGEAERIEETMQSLRASIDGTDRKRVRDLTEKLDEVTAPFAQRRIERDLQLALEGQDAERVLAELKRAT